MAATQVSTGKIRSGGDLAFAVVVLAAYFSTFSSLVSATPVQIILMILLGTAYITFGIYGFRAAQKSQASWTKLCYFVIQIILGSWIIYFGKGLGYNALVLLPLAGQSVMLLAGRWVYISNGAVVVAFTLVTRLMSGTWNEVWASLPIFLAGLVFIVVFTQMAVDEERARTEQERLSRQLEEANHQLREYALQAEDLAIVKERNRVAREIHDGLGHYLTTIHMQIQAALAIIESDPTRAAQTLDSARSLSQEALMDVRRSVAALRSSPEENLPLPERIKRLLSGCDALNIHPEFRLTGKQRELTPQAELTLFRAAQEGVNNACKHAKASQIWITLDYSMLNLVRLTVQDDGVGTEDLAGGFGLVGLQERVQMLNGEMRIASSQGQGFNLEIVVPQ